MKMNSSLVLCKRSFILIRQINKLALRLYSKTLTKENVIPLNENTLFGRIVLFLDNDRNKNSNTLRNAVNRIPHNDVIKNFNINRISHIKSLKCSEIEDLLQVLTNDSFVDNQWDFQKILRIIDLECCSRLDTLDSNSTLRLLNSYIHITPNRITEYQFYEAALNHLVSYVEFLTKEELLQTIFYISLQKKSTQSQVMLKICMKQFTNEDIKSFSVEELCIVCSSTFKTSTRITNKLLLNAVYSTLNNNLYLLKDPALFITLIKTVRHNHYQDEDLLSTISCTIFFNSTFRYYSFTALCHILALYADYTFYDDALLKLFIDKCVTYLKNSTIPQKTYSLEMIRFKDVTRFLWAVSLLGYKDIDEMVFKDIVVPRILERIITGLHKSDIEDLINCILYMWVLNYQAVELLPHALTERNILHIREIKSKTKERLNLLLTCMYFENRQLFKEIKIKPQAVQIGDMEYQLERRPSLRRVYAVLKTIAPNIEVSKFDLNYQIPYLNICGITGYKKKIYKAVYIEVLDDYVCVKNKKHCPIGPMQLKLRILNNLDEAVIILYNDEIMEMDDEELKEYLESELDLLC